jgi:hypothetical protein
MLGRIIILVLIAASARANWFEVWAHGLPKAGGSAAAWTPSNITLRAWFDISDTNAITITAYKTVQVAKDKSGNAADARVVTGYYENNYTPQYISTGLNGRATAKFHYSRHLFSKLNSPITNNTAFMAIAAYMITPPINTYERLVSLFSTNAATYDFNSVNYGILLRVGTGDTIAGYRNSAQLSTSGSLASSNFVAICVFDGTNNTVYINGVARTPVSCTGNFNAGAVSMGWFPGDSGFNGHMSEALYGATLCDTATRQKIEGYLAWKYGLQGLLSTDHPYKGAAP